METKAEHYSFIEREYWISCAHMLPGYNGNCARLHGHNYKVVVDLMGLVGDDGMVLDFAELDHIVKPILDKLDHRMLVAGNEWPYLLAGNTEQVGDHFYMVGERTTAENIARHLRDCIYEALCVAGIMPTEGDWLTDKDDKPVREIGVTVWETPRSSSYSA